MAKLACYSSESKVDTRGFYQFGGRQAVKPVGLGSVFHNEQAAMI